MTVRAPRDKTIVGVLLVLGASLASIAWYRQHASTEAPMPTSVEVVEGDFDVISSVRGSVQAAAKVELKSRASGEITQILVSEGDHVEPGAVLLKLDPSYEERSLREARVSVTKAQARSTKADGEAKKAMARLVEAEARLRTHASGLENGLYSLEQLRTAQLERDSAKADLIIANAEQQAFRAEVELAQLAVSGGVEKLEWTTIRSPIVGTVVSLGVERGSIVSSGLTSASGGTPLMTIAQLDTLYVVSELDESEIGKVAVGQLARLSTSAYAGQRFDGVVDRLGVSGRDDDGLVVFDVRIKLADEARSQLRLGMSVEAEIVTAEHHGVALIPSGALQRDRDGYYKVSIRDGDTRKVEVIADDGTRVAVKGVQPGEHIVLPNDVEAATDPDIHWTVQ